MEFAVYQTIINFWFTEISPKQWWQKDRDFDQLIAERFGEVHHRASMGEFYPWRAAALGRLAEIIVLDQFSRNIYRDSPRAFAQDAMALALAQEAITAGADQEFEAKQKIFLYMPYMHSESLLIHEQAVKLFQVDGLEDNYRFELKHKAIIERFGRYPHRNDLLGRGSTDEEIAFLKEPGSSF